MDLNHCFFVRVTSIFYIYFINTIRSGIQIPLIWYIAVSDRFTRREITYIQVTLPPYLKLRDVVKGIPWDEAFSMLSILKIKFI